MQASTLARLVALIPALTCACIEEQRYHVVDQEVRLTADAQPAYVTEDDDPVYRVDRPFSLRITPPTSDKLASLASASQGMNLPFPRLPWVSRHDLDLQLDWALTNEGDRPLVAMITVNGVNEFHFYAPGPENFHQWERRVEVAPGERVHGSVTELELDEVAVDLATVVNGAPNSNLVVEAMSQSGLDERTRAFVPRVIPGLVGLRVGLETMAAVPLLLEISVRVQDHGERAAKRGEERWELPAATPFVPVVPDLE